MARKPAWFGRLLDWQRDPQTDQYVAWHGGRSHYMVKLDRQGADAKRTQRGWHILAEDDYGQLDIGPHLGYDLPTAKENAEAWVICADSDLRQYPKLNLALYSGSAGYERLTIYKQADHQRFSVHRHPALGASDIGSRVGIILPVFIGVGGSVSIRWRACGPVEQLISGHDTWAEAVKALAAEAQR